MPMTFHALTSNVCVINLNRKLLADYIFLRTTINNLEAFTSSLDTKQDWEMHIFSSDVAYHCVTLLPSVVLHVHTGEHLRLTSTPRYISPPSLSPHHPLPWEEEGQTTEEKRAPPPPSFSPPQPLLYLTSSPSPLTTFPSLLLSLQPPPPPTVSPPGSRGKCPCQLLSHHCSIHVHVTYQPSFSEGSQ